MKQQSIIAITLLISVFLLFSTFTSLYSLSPATFGYMQIGQYTDLLIPGYKDSCRYQASESGTVNSISMYIQTANAQVRFGIYSDQNGKPSQLLAQSNQVTTVTNQWVVASLTASIVAGQYYWLTVTSNAPIRYYIDYVSGGSSGYAIEPTTTMSTNYVGFTAYTAVKYSMYATYTATASGPTPSPTVTPAPTPNPTAVPTVTPAPTPNPTAVPTVTPAPTPNPTAVPTVTPAPTPNPTAVPTVTPAPTPNPTAVPTVTPAPVTGTFGYMQVGKNSDLLIPGYKDSCRYQASESGTVNSISMYIQTANAQVRFGIYSDQNGKPSQLLAQSNQVTTVANQWVVASLTASIVAGQYYWLTVTSNAPIRYYIDYVSGGSSGYAIEPTTTMSTNYVGFTAYTAVKYSMYATYTATASGPTPSPTVTPAPTPNPTAVPTVTPAPTPNPTPYTPTPTPKPTPVPTATPSGTQNGIWTIGGQAMSSLNNLKSHGITEIYTNIGHWNKDGTITLTYSAGEIRGYVSSIRAVSGMHIYPWIITGTDNAQIIDLSTEAKRQSYVNSAVNLVQTYGFDGFTDDIELFTPLCNWDLLVTFYNQMATAMHSVGKTYNYAAHIYWATDMGVSRFQSIEADLAIPMLYGWGTYTLTQKEDSFKSKLNYFLTYSHTSIGLDSGLGDGISLSQYLTWTDQQLALSPKDKLHGSTIFWWNSMSSDNWSTWDRWVQ